MERNRFNVIHDIHGLLDLVKEMRIEPVTIWKHYVSQWDVEEQRIFLLKLIAISRKEIKEGRSENDLNRFVSYHLSYLNRKMNELQQQSNNEHEKIKIPDELNTENAKKWLKVAIDGGLLNSDYSTTNKVSTKPQKALLAEILSDRIGLRNKYKPFETLWGVNKLAQQRYKSREEKGKVKGDDIIMKVFNEK